MATVPDCIEFNSALCKLQSQLEPDHAELLNYTRQLLAEMALELDKMADGNPFASALLNRYYGEAPPEAAR